MTFATSPGLSVIGTWPQPGRVRNRACGMRASATRAWLGGSSRSLLPQAIVTGTSGGMASVKVTRSASTADTASRARKNA
jgi:hypothetical protein